MDHGAGATLAGFAVADIDSLWLARGDRLQLAAMALRDAFHAALPMFARHFLLRGARCRAAWQGLRECQSDLQLLAAVRHLWYLEK